MRRFLRKLSIALGKNKPAYSQEYPTMDRDGRLVLYRNTNAEKEAWYALNTVCGEIRLEFREGTPTLLRVSYTGTEYGVGKIGVGTQEAVYELPAELRDGLTPGTLTTWADETLGIDCPVPWADLDLQPLLEQWCDKMCRRAAVKLPDCVYLTENPFGELDTIGPDGLNNGSGIQYWVRMKQNADVTAVVEALAGMNVKGIIAVLTDSPVTFTERDRILCVENRIWFCLRTGADTIKDLITGREYKLEYTEWPGSADDAATYGEWWLTEIEPLAAKEKTAPLQTREVTDMNKKPSLSELSKQILADCREYGLNEEEIASVYNMLAPRYQSGNGLRLSIDRNTDRYTFWDWEKGRPSGGIEDMNPLNFRFKFLQEFIHKYKQLDPQYREEWETFLKKTSGKFSTTAEYQLTLKRCRQFIPGFKEPDPASPEEPNDQAARKGFVP